jgi:AbiV family abortive infection protein
MAKQTEDTGATLSKYKWKRLATEALINALRLHKDATLLFNAGSYPSAYQLAVLCLEEFSKAKWVEHYYYSCITNEGFPDAQFEQGWLQLLYMHGKKQYAFVAQDMFMYPPKLVDFIKSGGLDRRKQQAVYVGLEKVGKRVNVGSRITLPTSIGMKEAKRMISWINAEFIYVHKTLTFYEDFFGIAEMDAVMLSPAADVIFEWPHKSRTRSRKHLDAHRALASERVS